MKNVILLFTLSILTMVSVTAEEKGQELTTEELQMQRKRDSVWLEQAITRKTNELISKKDTLSLESLKVAKGYAESAEKQHQHFFTMLNVTLVMITVLGSAGLFLSIRQGKKAIDRRMKKELSKYGNEKKETLVNLVHEEELESKLRKNCHLAVIIKKGSKLPHTLEQILKQFGSGQKEEKLIAIENLEELSDGSHNLNSKVDLIVFHNPSNEAWTDRDDFSKSVENLQLIKWINELPDNIAFMNFGVQLSFDSLDETKRTLFSSANMDGQLYGNLINLLKFQNAIKNHSKA